MSLTTQSAVVYSDFNTPGVQSSGEKEPVKREIRELWAQVDITVGAFGLASAVTVAKATLALLNADLAHPAETLALVWDDPVDANNGFYVKSGISGAGAWTNLGISLPSTFADDLAEILSRLEELNAAVFEADAARDEAVSARDEIREYVIDGPEAASVVGKINKVATRADLPDQQTGVTFVWVGEVGAYYKWEGASALAADGWGVIAATGGGAGRWVLYSDGLTVQPSGADDAPTLIAAGTSMAELGRKLRLSSKLYLLNTIWSWPLRGLHCVATRETELRAGLVPDGSPANAPLLWIPGGAALIQASTLAANAGVAADTVSMAHAPAVDQYVRLRNDSSGDGFAGGLYQVVAVSGAGPYAVTLDRPLRNPLLTGDAADIFSNVPRGHRLEGFPKITGSATRLFEAGATWGCSIEAIFMPDDLSDAVASFDTFGYDNHFMPGTECYENGSGATDGIYLETQEQSSVSAKVRGFTAGIGVSIFHGVECIDRSFVTGCLIGAALRGYDAHGCIASELAGVYDGNTQSGASIINGSVLCRFTGAARFNPYNLVVGDPTAGNVDRAHVDGDLSSALIGALLIDSTAIGTSGGHIDTSDSTAGIVANGNLILDAQTHRGSVDISAAVIQAISSVQISNVDYNITNVANVVRGSADARITFGGGEIIAAAGSNLFNLTNNAYADPGKARATCAGGFGFFLDGANTRGRLEGDADFSAVGALLGGTGILFIPRKLLSINYAPVGTPASTVQTSLKLFVLPGGTMFPGTITRATWKGRLAPNANVKQLRANFGGNTALFQNQPTGEQTFICELIVRCNAAGSQTWSLRHTVGSSSTTAGGLWTLNEGNALTFELLGTNGTASANDIICDEMEVTHGSL